ncbi:MAG: dockerin type I domain-containing protein [Nanoarchaeota archaeon]
MKYVTIILLLMLILPNVIGIDTAYDFDGNGRLDLKDAAVLGKVLGDIQTCPSAKTCDVNGDGQIDKKDYTALVEKIKSQGSAIVPQIPTTLKQSSLVISSSNESLSHSGLTIEVEFEKTFKLQLFDTAKLHNPEFSVAYIGVKSCRANTSCAVILINNSEYIITKGTATLFGDKKLFLHNINNRNNSLWTLYPINTCNGCIYNGTCIAAGERDEILKVMCNLKNIVHLKPDNTSCQEANECISKSCIIGICGKESVLIEDVHEDELAISKQNQPSQNITPTQHPMLNLTSIPKKGFFSSLLNWFKSLF